MAHACVFNYFCNLRTLPFSLLFLDQTAESLSSVTFCLMNNHSGKFREITTVFDQQNGRMYVKKKTVEFVIFTSIKG